MKVFQMKKMPFINFNIQLFMNLKRLISAIILILCLVTSIFSNNLDDSKRIKLFLNSGVSLSRFNTILDNVELNNCIGFIISSEIQVGSNEGFYFGFKSRFDYFPNRNKLWTKEDLKYYYDNITTIPYSIDENTKATYSSLTFMPRVGGKWKKGDFKLWKILLFPYSFINSAEIHFGIGIAWYDIDRYITGAINDEVLNDEWMRENIKISMEPSELLHMLEKEWIISYGIKIGRDITQKIHIGISLNMNEGLKYSKFYEGHWVGGPGIQIWHEAHRNRMTMQNVMLEVGYKIF